MPAASDSFAALGLPRRFELSPHAIQAAYLKRAAALHPDRVRDPIEQAEAARQSAILNDARAALLDDEQRANALLQLLGGPSKEQDKSLPPDFLMQIMEARQDMEQVLAAADPAERARVEQWADQQRQQFRQTVAELFEQSAESPAPSPQTLRQIRMQLNAWRYIERMIEQLEPGDYPDG